MFNHAKIMNFLFPIDVLMRKSPSSASKGIIKGCGTTSRAAAPCWCQIAVMDYFTTLMVAVVPSL